MPKRIQLPDGTVGEFPDTMQDADIEAVLRKQFAPPPSWMQQHWQNLKDGITGPDGLVEFGKGAVKGAVNTVANIDAMAAKVPGLRTLVDPAKVADMQRRAVPNSPAQSIGKGVEQAGEFMLPGVGEEIAGAKLGGGVLARMAAKAAGSGLVNKVQGGGFLAGAAMGGAGEGIAQGFKAAAPGLAEKAIGIVRTDRKFGRQVGDAILGETSGYNPGVVAQQASDKIGALSDELQQAALNRPTTAVNLGPARDAAGAGFANAAAMNNDQSIRDMGTLTRQLESRDVIPGVRSKGTAPIPQGVSASEALALKRGVGALQTGWNSSGTPDFYNGVVGNVYHALDSEIDRALPEGAALNDRMSNLIPVAKRGAATDLNESLIGRTFGKIGKPTGALVGAGFGAEAGRREGGTSGAVMGGLTGLIAPELVTNPTTMMMAARAFNSPLTSRYILPGVSGAALQLARKKDTE